MLFILAIAQIPSVKASGIITEVGNNDAGACVTEANTLSLLPIDGSTGSSWDGRFLLGG